MGLPGVAGLTVVAVVYSRGQKLLGLCASEPHKRERDTPERGGCLKTPRIQGLRAERAVDATKCFLPWVWSHMISHSQSCVVAPGSPRSSLKRGTPSYYHCLTLSLLMAVLWLVRSPVQVRCAKGSSGRYWMFIYGTPWSRRCKCVHLHSHSSQRRTLTSVQ